MSARIPASVHVLALGALAALAACGPRPVTLPDPSTANRYPDFIFPAPPPGLGTPTVQERHDAAWLWLQTGDLKAAERNYNASLQLMPDFYPAEAGLGWVGLARGNNESAAAHFDRAVAANPRYVPALVGRGEALLALGRRETALKSFEAALALDADLPALRGRIEVLRLRGVQEDVAEARKQAEAGRLPQARRAYERAIAASPESPFLVRELAAVERGLGDLDAALEHATKAADMDPLDARTLVTIAEIHESRGDLARAVESYEAALALEPNPDTEKKIDDLRERLLLAAMPAEFLEIGSAPVLTRAQLAALLGVRLDSLLKRTSRRTPAVITDTRGSWAAPWIQSVTRSGLMEVYPNHTFQPASPVRRADLAQAASRVLSLIAAEKPQLASSWRNMRRKFPDVSPGHLAYPAVSLAVEAGIMQPLEDGSFQLARPVTGAEAVAAVRKLEELAESSGR